MVRYRNLIKAIGLYVEKCGPTIGEMKQMLSEMSYDEQFEQLKNQDLLNPMEIKDYEQHLDMRKRYDSFHEIWADQLKDPSEFMQQQIDQWEEAKNGAEKELFYYGRRLFEGVPHNEPPQVDKDYFNKDEQWYSYDELSDKEHHMGVCEQMDIETQGDVLNEDTLTENQWQSIHGYYGATLHSMVKDIRHGKYLGELDKEERRRVKDLDSVISQSIGLNNDTVLYMGGHLDNIHLNVGDHGVFKGYMSTSYQEDVADFFAFWKKQEGNFKYVIYAPQGTKGLCGNADNFSSVPYEHEFTLPRNTGYTVLDIDYDSNVIEIVLDEPNE